MPTFQPSEKERGDYQTIFRQVETQRAQFLNAEAVAIDLRRNQGGSSTWSYDFAAALWGKGRVERRVNARTASEEVWYRSSPENISLFHNYMKDAEAHGDSEEAKQLAVLEANMRAVAARGEPYYIQKGEPRKANISLELERAGDPPPFTRPTYVIVPGSCASACLDALDYFKMFPNVKLIGAPSSADSTYMEVRVEELPGGLARVVVPTKLYVNRQRGNGEFYRPDIPVTTLQWSTANFLDVVERDLSRLNGSVLQAKSPRVK